MLRKTLSLLLLLFAASCSPSRVSSEYFEKQAQITDLVQQGMYYFWNGGDYKKAEKEFFKGVTLKGNLEAVEKFFKQASELDANRLDIKYGLASTYILQKKFDEGFAVYRDILTINPKEFNAALLHAMYSKAANDEASFTKYMEMAKKIDPKKAKHYEDSLGAIDQYNKTKFNTVPVKKYQDREHAVVILGYALAENGEMQPALVERLKKGLEIARLYPNSKIIVSGAVPKQGNTEAGLMKAWLMKNGVSASNILAEDRAKDTVANAYFSVQILKNYPELKYVTVVSSASHMRRALNIFAETGYADGFNAEWDNLVYLDYPSLEEALVVSDAEKIVIYRDFLRASKIYAYPGLQQ